MQSSLNYYRIRTQYSYKEKIYLVYNHLSKYLYEGKTEREMFYLTMHSTHFIYGYMASDIWLRTTLIVRKETRCRHIGYSFRLAARVLLYAPSHRQDNTYHSLCYTGCGALAGTRNSSMGPPHEGSIWRPIASWANALPLSYVPLPGKTVSMQAQSYWMFCNCTQTISASPHVNKTQ